MSPTTINIVSLAIFVIAVLHTFSIKFFENLAHKSKHHSGFWHLLAEVEIVFGFWAMILVCFLFVQNGKSYVIQYLEGRNYTEPLFVFVVMVICASKPIYDLCLRSVVQMTRLLPINKSVGTFFITISVVPLLGSFITEPAAMTLAALLLKQRFYDKGISTKMMYASIGVLFVNVSIGGTLTPYAAPPVLMVCGKWDWDIVFMFKTFGWRSALAVAINASILTTVFFKEIRGLTATSATDSESTTPYYVSFVHLLFLVGVILSAHHSVIFMGLFLFFLGFTTAYEKYQSRLLMRESLLVAFFLAGLVVLGGQQKWWLQSLLLNLQPTIIFYGATLLTAITDNAAITYLCSLVDGLTDEFKYAIVSGAVTGGGLTVIANAPNPAGYSILKGNFDDENINPLLLLVYAIPPTLVAIVCFQFI